MEKIQLMNIKRQHEEHATEYEAAALKVLRGGQYIGGEEVSAFEKEFASYMGANYAVSCGNGTDALVLALRALGIGIGDEVITVAFTFFATAESIAAVGATPVFVDVCPDTYCMDTSLIEAKITKHTKAILPVHIYGNCADMSTLRKIAKKYGLYLITDCAQSTGSSYNGSRAETIGDVACCSFFPTKNLGCDGDGGMVLTNDESIAKAVRALSVHGSGIFGLETLKMLANKRKEAIPDDMPEGTSKYYNYLIGYNSRMDAVQAAILRIKLKYIDDFVSRRRTHAQAYSEALSGTSYALQRENGNNSYYIFALKHVDTQRIMTELTAAGIACGVYYPIPLHLQGAFSQLGYKAGSLPNTEELCKTTFAIPVYPELTIDERNFIISVLVKNDELNK